MNPDAIPLLKQNMEYFHSKRKQHGTYVVDCMDARNLMKSRPEIIGTADVLLVNLPHEGIDHLPDLLPLLLDDESLICGWSIQEKQADIEHQLREIIETSDWTIIKIHVEEVKGFSTAKTCSVTNCCCQTKTSAEFMNVKALEGSCAMLSSANVEQASTSQGQPHELMVSKSGAEYVAR